MTLQIILNEEAFCSENILCTKNTQLIPERVVPKDRFGQVIESEKRRLDFDPTKIVDISKNTIMPVFNENSFVFFMSP